MLAHTQYAIEVFTGMLLPSMAKSIPPNGKTHSLIHCGTVLLVGFTFFHFFLL